MTEAEKEAFAEKFGLPRPVRSSAKGIVPCQKEAEGQEIRHENTPEERWKGGKPKASAKKLKSAVKRHLQSRKEIRSAGRMATSQSPRSDKNSRSKGRQPAEAAAAAAAAAKSKAKAKAKATAEADESEETGFRCRSERQAAPASASAAAETASTAAAAAAARDAPGSGGKQQRGDNQSQGQRKKVEVKCWPLPSVPRWLP